MIAGRVVVGCDGALDSDAAVRFAVEEARLRHARLVVVVAFERPIDPDLDDFDIPDTELSDRARRDCQTGLRRALNTPAGWLPDHDLLVTRGEPARALLDAAAAAADADADATMIVIGAHDRPLLQRLFGHHTGQRLLRAGTVPVIIVPNPPD